MTVSEIENNTYFGHATIWHHIEHLSATEECLRMGRGDVNVYHLNNVIASFNELGLKGTELEALYHFDIVKTHMANISEFNAKEKAGLKLMKLAKV